MTQKDLELLLVALALVASAAPGLVIGAIAIKELRQRNWRRFFKMALVAVLVVLAGALLDWRLGILKPWLG